MSAAPVPVPMPPVPLANRVATAAALPDAPTQPPRGFGPLALDSLGQPARLAGALAAAAFLFALGLLALGKDPLAVYGAILTGALGDAYGWSELGVKLVPLVLCALAAAVPARVGLVNVGAEGQLYAGALVATWAALTLDAALPAAVLLPLMLLAGFAGGALWGGVAGLLRTAGLNEAISTLLLNYVAILLVNFFVHGPWKEPGANNWPFTREFSPAATLPALGDSRLHLGLLLPIVALASFAYVLARTRWGFEMRVIGGNPEAARWSGLPIARYLLVAMLVGGGLAGLAGMAEVAAIQHRLRPGFSNGYGYLGFLASWLAGGRPGGIAGAALLLGVIVVGGDVLQVGAGLPGATVNILMGLMLFAVLAVRRPGKGARA